MERDPNISKLVRESGILKAPENLTSRVMDLISEGPEKQAYKPIIGKTGRWIILLFVVGVVVASLLAAEPGQRIFSSEGVFSGLEFQMPQLTFNLDFISQISPSTGLVAGLVALFILVLSDAGIRRRRMA
jgi:hypothetical protein